MKTITIYFDRGRRMIQVSLAEVTETVERLLAKGYSITSAEAI